MKTDEILADVLAACELGAEAMPVHVIVLIEYLELDNEIHPGRARMVLKSDEDLTPWTSMGMLQFATQCEFADVRNLDEEDDDG